MLSKRIRVPGKIMLAGEYAVLFGERALAYTVDRFLEVDVGESQDGFFHLSSDIWGEEIVCKDLTELPLEKLRSPFLRALVESQKIFPSPPLKIKVRSQLDLSAGMGSSSALILGICLASSLFSKKKSSLLDIAKLAYSVQKDLQGQASGYDVLTQSQGGLLCMKPDFHSWPGVWEKIEAKDSVFSESIHLMASGKGSPTGPLVNDTLQALQNSSLRAEFLNHSSNLVDGFLLFLKGEILIQEFCKINKEYREFAHQFLSFPQEIVDTLKKMEGCDETWTFKTTGAGGDDAILLIGKSVPNLQGCYPLNCRYHSQGIYIEDLHENI